MNGTNTEGYTSFENPLSVASPRQRNSVGGTVAVNRRSFPRYSIRDNPIAESTAEVSQVDKKNRIVKGWLRQLLNDDIPLMDHIVACGQDQAEQKCSAELEGYSLGGTNKWLANASRAESCAHAALEVGARAAFSELAECLVAKMQDNLPDIQNLGDSDRQALCEEINACFFPDIFNNAVALGRDTIRPEVHDELGRGDDLIDAVVRSNSTAIRKAIEESISEQNILDKIASAFNYALNPDSIHRA